SHACSVPPGASIISAHRPPGPRTIGASSSSSAQPRRSRSEYGSTSGGPSPEPANATLTSAIGGDADSQRQVGASYTCSSSRRIACFDPLVHESAKRPPSLRTSSFGAAGAGTASVGSTRGAGRLRAVDGDGVTRTQARTVQPSSSGLSSSHLV